ncbi:MAG TPA: PAS domain-containing protein, partial [Bryobacteraceae bacterium]
MSYRIAGHKQATDGKPRVSRGRYEALVNSIDGAVWELELPDWRFTFVSEQAERILGYPVRQWLDDSEFWLNHLHPEDRSSAAEFRKMAASKREDYQFEYRMIAANGRVVWLRDLVSVKIADRADHQSGTLHGVLLDITKRKK